MKCEITNRIIVIGGNHQNTLAAIRCFGICGCNIHILLHADKDSTSLYCAQTRFSKGKVSIVDKDENGILQWLVANKTEEKQIIFPCSDLAAYTTDKNFDILSDGYYIPGFADAPGKVCIMMSKWEQKKFADKYDIPMAKSWLLEKKSDEKFIIPDDITYPCIVKPNVSAFGVKSDISICGNVEELTNTLLICSQKKYEALIVQDYLDESEEYGALGCVVSNKKLCVSDIVKRIYANKGNTIYAEFSRYNNDVQDMNDKIMDILYDSGFRGMFDIEYIVSNGKIFLLEINYRHSGIGFGQISNKVYAPYLYCLSVVGKNPNSKLKHNVSDKKTMIDETVCFTHRKQYGLSIAQWLKLCLTASAYAKFNIYDLKGTFKSYVYSLRK